MHRNRRWLWAVAALVGITPLLSAKEPASVKVDRFHNHVHPRDLTPQIYGSYYGFYETRWRMMPSEGMIETLPPTVIEVDPKQKGLPSVKPPGPRPKPLSESELKEVPSTPKRSPYPGTSL